MTPVELHCEQDVGGLGPAIGDHRVVGRALEIRIVEVDVRIAVVGTCPSEQVATAYLKRLQQNADSSHASAGAEVV
jgi:hypothetical protein